MNTNIHWTFICKVDDIPVLGSRRVTRDNGLDVAVFRNDKDEVFALLDRCPHKGGPLSQGIVFGTSVACPLHNWTISLCDGQASAPDEGCTPRFAVQVTNGEVFLDAQALASHATEETRPLAGPVRRQPIALHAPSPHGTRPAAGAKPSWERPGAGSIPIIPVK